MSDSAAGSRACAECGRVHDTPLAYGIPAPDLWNQLSPSERQHSHLDQELCSIVIRSDPASPHHFVRGRILLPISDRSHALELGVWSSLSPTGWRTILERWQVAGREYDHPYFGWLSNEISPFYRNTTNLKLHVHTQPLGIRPVFELEPTNHPLAVDQREGISWARVEAMASALRTGARGSSVL